MHKKIASKCSKKLMEDAEHYESRAHKTKSKTQKKHDLIERKEALSAAREMKKRSQKMHEY